MRSSLISGTAATVALITLFVCPFRAFPQNPAATPQSDNIEILPSAPVPAGVTESVNAALPFDQNPAAPQTPEEKRKHDQAEEQLKEQEKQRVMGVMATFNTTRNKDAVPLSPGQKFRLFFKSSTDPWPFLLAGAVGGINQATNSPPEWGQGAEGYAKRFGAAYSDSFIGNFFGNAVLPVVLREDPRYFQMGTGAPAKRFLWAAASTVWCRRDNGTWGPNYSNVGGNLIGAAISRVYYPPSQRTFADVVTGGLTVSAEGIVGAVIIEFWPDMARHFKSRAHKHWGPPAVGDQPQK
jgi:hypothetical protein